jgi:3-oxoisoapionate decarboxylase
MPEAAPLPRPKRLGLSTNTYGVRWRYGTAQLPQFNTSLNLLDHCVKLGAGGAQILVSRWTDDYARQVRERVERHGLYLEGQIALPQDEADTPRFDHEVATAKVAGIGIIRTVMLGGRRYENFATLEAWNEHKARAGRSLALARPIMAKHRVKLAVENHKDWRADEMVNVIRRMDSEWIGVNLDLGNNVALLDEPMAVIELLAPLTLTTHFKDMAVQEYEDGFLLSEVPLGDGVVDLKRAITILEKANPGVQFNLEMITRDPLKVPVYTDQYWVTFGELRARHLAETLALVRHRSSAKPLPTMSDKTLPERVAFEEQNNVASLDYARRELGL